MKTLKLLSMNVSNTVADTYLSRLKEVFKHAQSEGIQVFLIQEVPHILVSEVRLIAYEAGFKYNSIAPAMQHKTNPNRLSSTAVFSAIAIENSSALILTSYPTAQQGAVAKIRIDGIMYVFISVHFIWGSGNTDLRLKQAEQLNSYANRITRDNPSQHTVIIAGGTFNDTPNSDPIRYLRGELVPHSGEGAFWVDAGENQPPHPTTFPNSEYGKLVASSWGPLYPELVPPRMTDYVFVKDWVYGNEGHPLNYRTFGLKEQLSDRIGIMVDIVTG